MQDAPATGEDMFRAARIDEGADSGRNDRELRVAWAAGFFDGEGTVGLERQTSGNSYLRIAVGQLVREPLDILSKMWGGSVRGYIENDKPIYKWTATTRMAEQALREMLPYLVVKAEQARIALEFHYGKAPKMRTTPERVRDNNRIRVAAWRDGLPSPIGRWRVPQSELDRGFRYMEMIRAARP